MENYIDKLDISIKNYFKILSPKGIPDFILKYIENEQMQRIGKISMNCGMDYTNFFDINIPYSNLDHSIAVALIIWNFTKDKKQTLAGLFHDIATPVFKHSIDFMNKDYEKQESTEKFTSEIIENSEEITNLLKKDNIKLEEVVDYKIYQIADNEKPKMSADRLEYNFSSGLSLYKIWELEEIERCYNDITILRNENDIEELGFKTKKIAEEYINKVSKLWPQWISNEDKLSMQFIADSVKLLCDNNELTKKDLYILSEKEVLDKIKNTKISNLAKNFEKFRNTKKVYESDENVLGKYCKSINPKRRYIIPLVESEGKARRIDEISDIAKKQIEKYLNIKTKKYAYFDFNII